MNSNIEALQKLLQQLIACPSITPEDAHCQSILIDYLKTLGFHCQTFNQPPVANFYAEYGTGSNLLIFAGHTDVVPVGQTHLWQTNPFELVLKDGVFFGRGVADMKGSLTAMMLAAKQWVENYPTGGRLGFLITSGEEGDDYHLGTPYVMQELSKQKIKPQYCIVGEPSSTKKVGDTLKIGRRGSLTGKLIVQGKQGHVAYPHLAQNPIHLIAPVLVELSQKSWDQGNAHFPATSFQITHIQAGAEATNVIPQEARIYFNLRYSTDHTAESLKKIILDCLAKHQLNYQIEWIHSGEPVLTAKGRLLEVCQTVIKKHTQQEPDCSTTGGTSDGRFIAPYGIEVIELGPVNATIHQVNESVALDDLLILTEMYYDIIKNIL